MAEPKATYDLAAPLIRPYVQPLWPGALAIPFNTRDEEGRRIGLNDDHVSGRAVVLAFLNRPHDARSGGLLGALAGLADRLDALGATAIAVSASTDAGHNRRMKRAAGFAWPVACDSSGGLFASYGLHKGHEDADRLVVVTPFRQIRAWFDVEDDASATLETIMTVLDNSRAAEELRWSPLHAPILTVPNVLSAEECGKLVESVETDTPFMIRQPQPGEIAGNYKIPVYDYERQDRVDLIIKDRNALALLDERLFGRVTPMIKKAFAFDVTRREDLHIARYFGKREGIAVGHRDNMEPAVAHRRFALSVSLNDDYEGGGIVFGEFSPRPYRVPAGTAMVFSSSLLHEVQETTAGTRYNLISHLFA